MEDLLLNSVLFVIDEEIVKLEDSDEKYQKIIYQSLIRSRAILEKINICGVNIIGKSYEEFKSDLDEKHNVVLMTDEELEKVKNALKVYDTLHKLEALEQIRRDKNE